MAVLETTTSTELTAAVLTAVETLSTITHDGPLGPTVRIDLSTTGATVTAISAEISAAGPDEGRALAELGRQVASDAAGRFQMATKRGYPENDTVRAALRSLMSAFASWRP